MPRGNGTGPIGMGSMTGRKMGYCAGNNVPGCNNSGIGCGRNRSFVSYLRNCNLGYAPFMRTGDEKELLTRQAAALENQLQQVKRRLDDIGD